MARNGVQFQKGLSEPAFEQQYGTEEQCRAIVVAARWPRGFECPACGGKQYSLVTTRNLYQCSKCRRQTSAIAGTIFASTHLPLRLWFRAIAPISVVSVPAASGVEGLPARRHSSSRSRQPQRESRFD